MITSRSRIKYYLSEITIVSILWVFCSLLFVYVKLNDIPNSFLAKAYGLAPWMDKKWIYLYTTITAGAVGLFMGLINTFLYPLIIKTGNFIISIFLRVFIFFILAFTSSSVFLILLDLDLSQFLEQGASNIRNSVLDAFVFMNIIEIMVGIIMTMRRNLGKNYFRKFIQNSYFVPKEEERVFVFTDLKNSTQLVEKLGSTLFSNFIQDCFSDFSDLALDYGGEIYQFVGDEVVTTWRINKSFRYEDALDLHFNFLKKLNSQRDYYTNKYGHAPEFWSSIHCGKVSAALVGKYKTEVAYHGRVLNLCSRLQAVCRDYSADMVISEDFYWKLPKSSSYDYLPILNLELKGIAERQLVFKVRKLKVDK